MATNVRAKESKLGLAWRPELSHFIAREQHGVAFSEVLAEDFWGCTTLPEPVQNLRERGVDIIPHATSLSLGGGKKPDDSRLAKLAALAERLDAPFVSEHFAFVRAAGLESGHLLPFRRNEQTLELVIENIRYAQARLPVPLCLENIATLFDWPDQQISEADFIARIVKETGIGLLLDVANLYANCKNFGWSSAQYLGALPLESIFYVHIAGGDMVGDMYHDTHAHPLQDGPLAVLKELCRRTTPPAVLLEQDGNFAGAETVRRELAAITAALSGDVAVGVDAAVAADVARAIAADAVPADAVPADAVPADAALADAALALGRA